MVDEIKKALEDLFGEKFSNDDSVEQFKHVYDLQHFDGRLHWGVMLDTQKCYIWITAGLRHAADHVLESHGYYESVRVSKIWGMDGDSGLPIEKDNRNWGLHLLPREGNLRSEGTFIYRHSHGGIEIEMCVGKEPPSPTDA